jgi:hypothetical protein
MWTRPRGHDPEGRRPPHGSGGWQRDIWPLPMAANTSWVRWPCWRCRASVPARLMVLAFTRSILSPASRRRCSQPQLAAIGNKSSPQIQCDAVCQNANPKDDCDCEERRNNSDKDDDFRPLQGLVVGQPLRYTGTAGTGRQQRVDPGYECRGTAALVGIGVVGVAAASVLIITMITTTPPHQQLNKTLSHQRNLISSKAKSQPFPRAGFFGSEGWECA